MIDLKKVIGIFTISNTGSVLIYELDYGGDRILAGINDNAPEWCRLTEELNEETGDLEPGFFLGSFFVPMSQIMRFYGEN